jgi:predicted permease
LVVGEIALALTVLTCAALLVKSLVRLEQADPGFRPEGVISFGLSLPNQPYQDEARVGAFTTELDRRLRALPGVRSVAAASSLPPNRLSMTNNDTLEGAAVDTAGRSGVAEWIVVSTDYFRTLGIRLARGRMFEASDRDGGPEVAVVNESFVRRYLSDREALGARLKGGNWNPARPWITIVGVVADVPYDNGALSGSSPTIYTAYAQNLWVQSPYVVVRADADPAALVPAIGAAVTALDGRVPLRDVTTMTERIRQSTAVPRLRGLLFTSLGLLGLVLAVTGVYGVMAYHVTERRRETAIRRALGARTDQVVGMTLATGARLAVAGIAVGTLVVFAATRSLSQFLYQVEPQDPAVLTGAAILLTTAALLACGWPAVRAARVDPATLLRDE